MNRETDAGFQSDSWELKNERMCNIQLHVNTDGLQQELGEKEPEDAKNSPRELRATCDKLQKEITGEKMSYKKIQVNSDMLLQKLEDSTLTISNLQTYRDEILVVFKKLQQEVNEQNLTIS